MFVGKYYLGDAGFSLTEHVLTPYRGVAYHLQEYRIVPNGRRYRAAVNKEELFNFRHSSLRCTIERCFGVAKRRFAILDEMPSFPFPMQIRLVHSSFMLHNFICRHGALVRLNGDDDDGVVDVYDGDGAYDNNDTDDDNDDDDGAATPRNVGGMNRPQRTAATDAARIKRDEIANKMWTDFQRDEAEDRRHRARRANR
jgi:hypothetical protein